MCHQQLSQPQHFSAQAVPFQSSLVGQLNKRLAPWFAPRLVLSCLALIGFIAPLTATPLEEILPPGELQALRHQETALFDTLQPLAASVANSVVTIRNGRNQWLSFGTVVAPAQVLTKASQLRGRIFYAQDQSGKLHVARRIAADPEHDLALLQVDSLDAPALAAPVAPPPQPGNFLVAVGMNAAVASFGTTSVRARTLRETDLAYLGIIVSERSELQPGLPIDTVPPGPARKAGVRGGAFLLKIDGKEVTSPFQLRTTLLEYAPGDTIKLTLQQYDQTKQVEVTLGNRPAMRQGLTERELNRMNRLGGNRMSRVKDSFPNVIQSDMIIKPEQTGAPVLDLNGHWVGMLIARGGRIESYVTPTTVIQEFIQSAAR